MTWEKAMRKLTYLLFLWQIAELQLMFRWVIQQRNRDRGEYGLSLDLSVLLDTNLNYCFSHSLMEENFSFCDSAMSTEGVDLMRSWAGCLGRLFPGSRLQSAFWSLLLDTRFSRKACCEHGMHINITRLLSVCVEVTS